MRKITTMGAIPLTGLVLLAFNACSEAPNANDQALLSMQAEITSPSVTGTSISRPITDSTGTAGDAVRITRIRILISDLKLHRYNGEGNDCDRSVKTGPMIVEFDTSGSKVFASCPIPPGVYDKVKLEFHRINSHEEGHYGMSPRFADFMMSDRSSIVIDGIMCSNGSATPFTYRSSMTANLELKLDFAINLAVGSTTKLAFVFDPIVIFRDVTTGKLRDPRCPCTGREIEQAMTCAIKTCKR